MSEKDNRHLQAGLPVGRKHKYVCVFLCVCVCVCVCVFVAKTTNKFCTRYVTNMREIIFAILTIFIFVSSLHDIIFQVFSSPFLIVEYLPIVRPPPLFFILKRFYMLCALTHCVFVSYTCVLNPLSSKMNCIHRDVTKQCISRGAKY